MPALVWFRRDLRTRDNPALYHAARRSTDGVIGLFMITPRQWQEHDEAAEKVAFWLSNLQLLGEELDKLNIPLLIDRCPTFDGVPKKIVSIARRHQCGSLYFNHEYEVHEAGRDKQTAAACATAGIEVHTYHDRVIVPPTEIATKDGRFYSVFTPYRRVWDTRALDHAELLARPRKQATIDVSSSAVPERVTGFTFSGQHQELWPAGEAAAMRRLKKFASRISEYDSARDIPAEDGTSRLSPYLAAGVISPRQCLTAALDAGGGRMDGDEGVATWISELTWRDFYTHVLVGFPRVSKHQPFKLKTNAVPWRTDQREFEAWCQGQTGYPIVDAGMRQLNQTGWMHNRLRMVTAMFLTKHLLIDWRWGEQYFMQRLIDGDLAANNGGWQWSASTGTDAVPYFRIFNPFSQSKRFDQQGTFIKQMCPELVSVPPAALHDAKKLTQAIDQRGLDYPPFIVDHNTARDRALTAFKSLA